MNHSLTANRYFTVYLCLIIFLAGLSCKKTEKITTNNKPKASFTITRKNQGALPDTVLFSSTALSATSIRWDLGNGTTSTVDNPQVVYTNPGTYNVKLVAFNQYGSDSMIKQVSVTLNKPTANFTFTIRNQGYLPDTVDFVSTTTNAMSLQWYFGDGKTDSVASPRNIFTTHGTFNVKLVATNAAGSDSVTKTVNLTLNKPIANFSYTTSNLEVLPVTLTINNTTIGSNVTYSWSFGNGSSTQKNPINSYSTGGIYNIKLVATNASGSDSMTRQIRISPYPQAYTNFGGTALNLFAWEGQKIMILSRNSTLNRATMFKWLKAMDTTYNYYKACTGREPILYAPNNYINNRATIADVANTCGAGCGYLGWTGIELQSTYFDIMYNGINTTDRYDQAVFYEFGRNFWFYGDKLAYKTNDPITTGYAVFMRFMSMEAAGVNGAPFGPWTFPTFRANVENLINTYLANPSLTWANTLGVGQGVPNSGLGATDLFASFCFRLRRDYGGETFIRNVWKQAGLRPNAVTTQDAVDNFFLASCAAANRNLTILFQSWRWPLSASAISAASQYP